MRVQASVWHASEFVRVRVNVAVCGGGGRGVVACAASLRASQR